MEPKNLIDDIDLFRRVSEGKWAWKTINVFMVTLIHFCFDHSLLFHFSHFLVSFTLLLHIFANNYMLVIHFFLFLFLYVSSWFMFQIHNVLSCLELNLIEDDKKHSITLERPCYKTNRTNSVNWYYEGDRITLWKTSMINGK